MFKIDEKVKFLTGRNEGEIGTVKSINNEMYSYCVDFNRKLSMNEGGGSLSNYDDFYWIHEMFLEKVPCIISKCSQRKPL